MKKILCSFFFLLFWGALYAQDTKCYVPKQGDNGLSFESGSIFYLINGNMYENSIRWKSLLTDDFMVALGFSASGLEDGSSTFDKASIRALMVDLGFQYYFASKNRLRPFTGFSFAFCNASADLSLVDTPSIENLNIRYRSPYFLTLGAGVEFFLYPNISLSTDMSFVFSAFQEGDNDFLTVLYTTCLGGLGGKLMLNVYF